MIPEDKIKEAFEHYKNNKTRCAGKDPDWIAGVKWAQVYLNELIIKSTSDSETFFEALANPKKPSKDLIDAAGKLKEWLNEKGTTT